MKKIVFSALVAVATVLVPLSVHAQYYGLSDPNGLGTASNPIKVKIQDPIRVQIQETPDQRQDDLKKQYGLSEFYYCYHQQSCTKTDLSDWDLAFQCTSYIQYCLEQRALMGRMKNLTPADAPVAAPQKSNDQICKDSFGPHSYAGGPMQVLDDGSVKPICMCEAGYDLNGLFANGPFVKTETKCIAKPNNTQTVIHAQKVTPTTNVNLRQKPAASFKIISVAKKGVPYDISDTSNPSWIKIVVGTKEGWVMRKYVDIK